MPIRFLCPKKASYRLAFFLPFFLAFFAIPFSFKKSHERKHNNDTLWNSSRPLPIQDTLPGELRKERSPKDKDIEATMQERDSASLLVEFDLNSLDRFLYTSQTGGIVIISWEFAKQKNTADEVFSSGFWRFPPTAMGHQGDRKPNGKAPLAGKVAPPGKKRWLWRRRLSGRNWDQRTLTRGKSAALRDRTRPPELAFRLERLDRVFQGAHKAPRRLGIDEG